MASAFFFARAMHTALSTPSLGLRVVVVDVAVAVVALRGGGEEEVGPVAVGNH